MPSHIRNFHSVSGVNIAGTLVPISDKIVILGVTLDHHLVLSHHTSNVCRAELVTCSVQNWDEDSLHHIQSTYHRPANILEHLLITIHLCVLYVQLISTFCSTHRFPLSLPRGHSVTSHLKFGTTYTSISGFALPYQPSYVISKRTYLNSILHFTPAILLT